MARLKVFPKVGCAAVFLAGCTSLPNLDTPVDENSRPTVSTIIEKISCEIAEAKDALAKEPNPLVGYQPFDKWTAAATLTLTVDDTLGTATAGLPISFIDVASQAETFAFGWSPTLYQNRTRTNAQSYSIDIGKLPKYEICNERLKLANNFNLEGDLGLKNQILMNIHAFSGSATDANYYAQGVPQGTASSSTPGTNHEPLAKTADTFSITAYFKVYFGVNNVAPAWTLTTFKGPAAGVGYIRDDLHQVVITFAPVPTTTKQAAKLKLADNESHFPNSSAVNEAAKKVKEAGDTLSSVEPQALLPKATDKDRESFLSAQRAYSNAQQNYNNALAIYANDVLAYAVRVQQYNAAIAASAQLAATPNAADAARAANAQAVTNAAINSLSQSLNRP